MTKAQTIPFSKIPKYSDLFLDFLHDFSKVQDFFTSPYSLDHFKKEALVHARQLDHRSELCRILEIQNREFGAGERTFEHLERLKDPDCWAVVTGQQVGLFTGPAYTVFKALTAVKLAAHYACRGIKAVPVFWMASEDHDLAEVDHTYLLDSDSQPKLIRYEGPALDQGRPVGNVAFSNSIQAVEEEFSALLPDSEFTREFRPLFKRAYRERKTFASAFGELFSNIFSNYGLILLNPQSPELKALAKPAFRRILEISEKLHSLVQLRSQQLNRSGYHAQVVLDDDATGLFFEDHDKRCSLIREDDLVRVKGTDISHSPQEWQARIEEAPWRFSPNVLFRPVVQDFLLPTLAYVGGPSEVAYLAQVGPLYRELDLRAPIVFPRSSFSIIEKKVAKILEKYDLKFADVFLGSEALIKRIVEQNLDQRLVGRFDEIEAKLGSMLAELDGPLRAVDQTLGEALKTAQQKVQYQINHLRTKFVHAEARQQEVLSKQIEKALSILYPLKTLQERRVNIFYFLSRYGMDFLAQLYEEIDLTDPDHRLCFIA